MEILSIALAGVTTPSPQPTSPTPGTHEPTEDAMGSCSGNWIGGVMVDEVVVPPLPAGDYVLGFRWDCEATSQVWSSCADVRLVEA